MPTYVYEDPNVMCSNLPRRELNVPIDERDNQFCTTCNTELVRKIAFTGLTWAPTAGGMR